MSNTKTRMGILGGSFDPIHFGHIKPCLELAEKFHLSCIRLIPCKVSPFKDDTHASAQHRWNMVSMVAANSELFVADARELERHSPSYTLDTLLEISRETAPHTTLFWIMGEDALQQFPDWHMPEKIMQCCHILVMRRPGFRLARETKNTQWLSRYLCEDITQLEKKDYGHIFITETQMFDISSTQIRATLQAGQQPRYMLPGNVWNYIKRHHLYQYQENPVQPQSN